MAKTILVVANETLGGRPLIEAVKERAAQGDASFVVIAPQNRPKSGLVIYDETTEAAAKHRVDTTIRQLHEAGVAASAGDVVDPDPFSAVKDAVEELGVDEIIISTHPETRSGWLRKGLVERIKSELDLPVTHVVVDLDAERRNASHTLVVANQTIGGESLFALLKGKAGGDQNQRFILIVPPLSGEPDDTAAARERLDALLERMDSEGLEATGALGDPDPFTAIMNALQFYTVDGIVISTYPETKSGWLRTDLIERVQRATSTPVEHVIANAEVAV